MKWISGVLCVLAIISAAGCASHDTRPSHVIIVSIDGFAADYLWDPRADLPELRRLAREGAYARRMTVSFPSVTWTCHTTLVTGATPARHGIIANSFFDRKSGENVAFIGDAVFEKAQAVEVPTLYDAAHNAGWTTASVIWPAASGASSLDWIIPDSNQEALHRKYTTPGLAAELEGANLPIGHLGRWGWSHEFSAARDDLYTRIAAYLLEEHAPGLLLLHLITPDGVEHDRGPLTPEAYWSVRFADERIGRIRRALESPALRGRAALFVVADHGFLPYDSEVRLNALFAKEGLIELDEKKEKPVRRKAWAVSAGGSASVYILENDPAARVALADRVAGLLARTQGVERVIRPSQYPALGLPDPAVNPRQGDLMVNAADGYAFANGLDGDVVVPVKDPPRGTHGHLPEHPRLGALFIAWGAGIAEGVTIDEARAVDVAPTAAHLMGIGLPGAEGRVLEEILR